MFACILLQLSFRLVFIKKQNLATQYTKFACLLKFTEFLNEDVNDVRKTFSLEIMSVKLIVLQCKRYIIQVRSVYPNKIS